MELVKQFHTPVAFIGVWLLNTISLPHYGKERERSHTANSGVEGGACGVSGSQMGVAHSSDETSLQGEAGDTIKLGISVSIEVCELSLASVSSEERDEDEEAFPKV